MAADWILLVVLVLIALAGPIWGVDSRVHDRWWGAAVPSRREPTHPVALAHPPRGVRAERRDPRG